MHLDKPVVCRYCLKSINEAYLLLATTYPQNSERLNYILAASEYSSQRGIWIMIMLWNFDYIEDLLE